MLLIGICHDFHAPVRAQDRPIGRAAGVTAPLRAMAFDLEASIVSAG